MKDLTTKIITVDGLSKAIRNSIDRKGLTNEETKKMATHILNFFGFNERIIDNVLEPEDRDAFYMLEEYGLLGTEREEISLHDGREWRIHYWVLKKDKILSSAKSKSASKRIQNDNNYDIYNNLPENLWEMKNNGQRLNR